MTTSRSDPENSELQSAMELLLRLRTRDQEGGALRVVFPDTQTNVIDQLLSQEIAPRRTSQELIWECRKVLIALQERDAAQGFLSDTERTEVKRALTGLQTTRQKNPRHLITLRRSIAVLTAAVALMGVAIGLGQLGQTDQTPPARPPIGGQPLPPAAEQPLTRTNLEQMYKLFGGWETIAPSQQQPDTQHPALLVFKQDGGTLASRQWTVPFKPGAWEQQASTNIARLSVEGTSVQITSIMDQPFIVRTGQPFIFERTPGQMFVVDEVGHVWRIDLAGATALRQPLR
jgi:hypothetical protein